VSGQHCAILLVFATVLSNFVHQQVTAKKTNKQTIYTKHQNTVDVLDYQAVSHICVGFVAAAVSMPMGGCRAGRSLVVVVVSVATELTVL